MAEVKANPIVQGLSGGLGRDLMFRRLRDGRTILCVKPDFSRRVFSEGQLSHQERFKLAAAYAKWAAKAQPIYAELAAGTLKSAYNVALSDWFHAAEILAVDVGGWTGEAGATLRLQARDDVRVAGVSVLIRVGETVVEAGDAIQTDGLWWDYVTQAAVSGEISVGVRVVDLAGNGVEAGVGVDKSSVSSPQGG